MDLDLCDRAGLLLKSMCVATLEPHKMVKMEKTDRVERWDVSDIMPLTGRSRIPAVSSMVATVAQLERQVDERKKDLGAILPFISLVDPDAPTEEVAVGACIPHLFRAYHFSLHCQLLLENILSQASSIYDGSSSAFGPVSKFVPMQLIIELVCDVLILVLTMEQAIVENKDLIAAWPQFRKMWNYCTESEPERFLPNHTETDREQQFQTLSTVVDRIDAQLLSGMLFNATLHQLENLPIARCARAKTIFSTTLQSFWQGVTLEKQWSSETYQTALRCYTGFALFFRLYKEKVPSKLYKSLWGLQKTRPVLLLQGQASLLVYQFMQDHFPVPNFRITPTVQSCVSAHKVLLRKQDEAFCDSVASLYQNVSSWSARIQSVEPMLRDVEQLTFTVGRVSYLLLEGHQLGFTVQTLLRENTNQHTHLSVPYQQRNIRPLARLFELLLRIRRDMEQQSKLWSSFFPYLLEAERTVLMKLLNAVLADSNARSYAGKSEATKTYIQSTLEVAIEQINAPPSKLRVAALHASLCLGIYLPLWKPLQLKQLFSSFRRMEGITHWQSILYIASDCSSIGFLMDLVPPMLHDIVASPDQAPRLPLLLAALQEGTKLLQWSPTRYQKHVLDLVRAEVVSPLTQQIEDDLRYQVHAHMAQRPGSSAFYYPLLQLEPLELWDTIVSLKELVERHLDETYYNLSAVALHDWKVYAEMRVLAEHKYHLRLQDLHLPTHSHYHQGLDVMEIMRNIHVFVSKFNYNLNMQLFVERAVDQKHLFSISMDHIVNSIKTHGTGISNTTVMYVFQFLRHKFQVFSEFLFDDHIKSRLLKDIRSFTKSRGTWKNMYPMERAERFHREIRVLGCTEDGRTYLDHFRQLITEIGNALGYVRMIRAGGRRVVGTMEQYIPTDREGLFSQMEAEGEVRIAAEEMDRVLDLKRTYTDKDYLETMLTAFSSTLRSVEHLESFFIIVPPLSVNFIESMVPKKERLKDWRRGEDEMAFCNDGFAMGLAYILRVLDQDAKFDSLHWFDSVKTTLDARKGELKQAKDEHGVAMSAARLRLVSQEYELLFYALNGSRSFFRQRAAAPHASELDVTSTASPNSDMQ